MKSPSAACWHIHCCATSPGAGEPRRRAESDDWRSLHTVEVDGQTIAYRQAGRAQRWYCFMGSYGFPVLEAPAIGSIGPVPGRRLGCARRGISSDPPNTFTTAGYAHCLAGFLDAIGIEQAHVLGLSWGGILAQEFYRLYAERFRSLVLADTYAGWRGSLPETVWKERLATCLEDAIGPPETLVAKFLPGIFSDAAPRHLREELAAIISEFHPVGFRLMSLSPQRSTREPAAENRVATLVLWGDDDRRSPLHVAEQFHAAIPGAELAIIPNAGHLSNMEQPDVFNRHVRRFCFRPNSRAQPARFRRT